MADSDTSAFFSTFLIPVIVVMVVFSICSSLTFRWYWRQHQLRVARMREAFENAEPIEITVVQTTIFANSAPRTDAFEYCTHCGSARPHEGEYCSGCGSHFGAASAASAHADLESSYFARGATAVPMARVVGPNSGEAHSFGGYSEVSSAEAKDFVHLT